MIGKPTILFMGTAAFALPALRLLVEKKYPLAAVVTQPDSPQGRGRTLLPSPVKQFALSQHCPILQPERVRDVAFIRKLQDIAPDALVLAAYGQLLPGEIINQPQRPCLNIHPSLLPKYRGAAPINWAIINGEEKSGVTIMYMAEELDAGDIILQEETPIGTEETFDQLHDRLALRGAELLIRAIEMIMDGTAPRIPQDGTAATYAPRLRKEDGLINWNEDCRRIAHLILGLSSVPGAYTFLEGKKVKIFGARAEEREVKEVPGTVLCPGKSDLVVTAGNGYVHLLDLQMESKKRMPPGDFLRGYQLRPGTVLGK